MEELATFLCKTAEKRSNYVQRRNRDLRIEAVLEATLRRTRTEMDIRQNLRKRRWESVKEEWLSRTVENCKRFRKTEDIVWCTNNKGQWGPDGGCEEDIFNLKQFFSDLDAVIKRNVTWINLLRCIVYHIGMCNVCDGLVLTVYFFAYSIASFVLGRRGRLGPSKSFNKDIKKNLSCVDVRWVLRSVGFREVGRPPLIPCGVVDRKVFLFPGEHSSVDDRSAFVVGVSTSKMKFHSRSGGSGKQVITPRVPW